VPIESGKPVTVSPGSHEPFHWPAGNQPHDAVCIRCSGFNWSGSVGVESEADSAVLLRPAPGAVGSLLSLPSFAMFPDADHTVPSLHWLLAAFVPLCTSSL
jgi:hypothetical protein